MGGRRGGGAAGDVTWHGSDGLFWNGAWRGAEAWRGGQPDAGGGVGRSSVLLCSGVIQRGDATDKRSGYLRQRRRTRSRDRSRSPAVHSRLLALLYFQLGGGRDLRGQVRGGLRLGARLFGGGGRAWPRLSTSLPSAAAIACARSICACACCPPSRRLMTDGEAPARDTSSLMVQPVAVRAARRRAAWPAAIQGLGSLSPPCHPCLDSALVYPFRRARPMIIRRANRAFQETWDALRSPDSAARRVLSAGQGAGTRSGWVPVPPTAEDIGAVTPRHPRVNPFTR